MDESDDDSDYSDTDTDSCSSEDEAEDNEHIVTNCYLIHTGREQFHALKTFFFIIFHYRRDVRALYIEKLQHDLHNSKRILSNIAQQ